MKTMEMIAGLGGGSCERQLEKSIKKLMEAVKQSGKAGSISLKIGIKPLQDGQTSQIVAGFDVSEKLPKAETPLSIFFADSEGELHREDPAQLSLGADFEVDALNKTAEPVTEVMDDLTGEYKEVK